MIKTDSNLTQAIDYALEDIKDITEKLDTMRWFQTYVEPFVPEGVDMGRSHYDYPSKDSLYLTIPFVEDRKWTGRNGTGSLVYKVRKAFGIGKFERQVYTYGGSISNSYSGTGTVLDENGNEHQMFVMVSLGGQLPPTCKIEWTEEEVTTTKKVGKVVCE